MNYTFSKLRLAKYILFLETIIQVLTVFTEAVSNTKLKVVGSRINYTGQSLVVIIVAIIMIFSSLMISRNLKLSLGRGILRISMGCVCLSIISISYRSFTCWFLQLPSNPYYLPTYNVTTIAIIIGACLWIPLGFLKDENYLTEIAEDSRNEIRSTGGPPAVPVYRPNNEDHEDHELPSYYEMVSPPAYKHKTPSIY